jgi:hypothetical protein
MKSYSLYLDASGDPGWPPPFGKSQIKFYVMAGLALTPEQDHKAHIETDRILNKYIPSARWASLADKYELHYHSLIRGKGIYSKLQRLELKAMADEVFDFLLDLKPVLFATVVDKVKQKLKYGPGAYKPRRLAVRATIHRFCMFLDREKGVGSVIMDEEDYRKDKEIQEMVHRFRTFGITIRGIRYQPLKESWLERVLNAINFTPSEMSPGIQLADFCSRSTWQHFERGKSNRFNQLSPLWDREQNRVYEPSVVPK